MDDCTCIPSYSEAKTTNGEDLFFRRSVEDAIAESFYQVTCAIFVLSVHLGGVSGIAHVRAMETR